TSPYAGSACRYRCSAGNGQPLGRFGWRFDWGGDSRGPCDFDTAQCGCSKCSPHRCRNFYGRSGGPNGYARKSCHRCQHLLHRRGRRVDQRVEHGALPNNFRLAMAAVAGPPGISQLMAWPTEHLTDAAEHWEAAHDLGEGGKAVFGWVLVGGVLVWTLLS